MNAPARIAALHVPAGWSSFVEREGDPDGALPHQIAVSPQGDQLQVRWFYGQPFTSDHFAMLVAVGFGDGPVGGNWTAETLQEAFDRLPAYRRAVVEQPAPALASDPAPLDPDEARRRRTDAAFANVTSAMRGLHLFEEQTLRAGQANPNLCLHVPMYRIDMVQDSLAHAGRLLLGEVEA